MIQAPGVLYSKVRLLAFASKADKVSQEKNTLAYFWWKKKV
jgi:hypothetical protein